MFCVYTLFLGPRQMPDRSGLPSAVFGTGADRFGLPSGVRGIPGVVYFSHCAAKGTVSKTAAASSLAFIQSLLYKDYITSWRMAKRSEATWFRPARFC